MEYGSDMRIALLHLTICLAITGCRQSVVIEPGEVNYAIVWMFARSPTSPVLCYVNEDSRSAGETFARDVLDRKYIPAFRVGSKQLIDLARLAANAPNRQIQKMPPYFVIEIGGEDFKVISYAMDRETLHRALYLMPPDVQQYLQLMYDSSAP